MLVALAAIGMLAVVGVLAALLLTGRHCAPNNGLSSARPVRAHASLLPAAALFGDTVTARVQLVTDTSFVQPDSLRIRGSFGPYRQVSRPVVERRRVGSTEEVAVDDEASLPRKPVRAEEEGESGSRSRRRA